MATCCPNVTMRVLTTLAVASPIPAATPRAGRRPNPALVGSNGDGAAGSLRTASYPLLRSFRATNPLSMAVPVETSFPRPLGTDHLVPSRRHGAQEIYLTR